MTTVLEEEKKKIENKKLKVKELERIFKEREKKQRARLFEEIGRLAYQANIDQIDKSTLMGAFLEIASQKNDPATLAKWKKNATSFTKEQEDSPQEALIISFQNEPPKEAKAKLKAMGFKWNVFRKEYYGYGSQKEMQNHLKGCDVSIEITT
jgi:hypothetical protein